MRQMRLDQRGWTRAIVLLAAMLMAWGIVAPGGAFWAVALAIALCGAGLATAMLIRSRRVPTLAQVIERAEADPDAGRR